MILLSEMDDSSFASDKKLILYYSSVYQNCAFCVKYAILVPLQLNFYGRRVKNIKFYAFPIMVKTRFAPSPTGEPHIGNIRTALFAWLFARSNGGKFFLRIEDTDKMRERIGAVEAITKSLSWLSLDYDAISKNTPIMFQSLRLAEYKRHALDLLQNGEAYGCSCSPERLLQLREKQMRAHRPPRYDGLCRNRKEQYQPGSSVIRMKMPQEGVTEFNDIIRAVVRFENKLIDDQVIIKSDGYPTYHLANVVDDHDLGITHVIRGEDWLSSTPKHLALYRALGWEAPQFAHLPMILGIDKSKLSKRHGAMPIMAYKAAGYLPEPFFNYLALLGWHPKDDKEVMERAEIMKSFTLDRVQKAGAVFDPEKLDWMNGVYIRNCPTNELTERLKKFGETDDPETVAILDSLQNALPKKNFDKALALVAGRMRTLKDFAYLAAFLTETNSYSADLLNFKNVLKEATAHSLAMCLELLNAVPESEYSISRFSHYFNHLIAQNDLSVGEILHPLRVALTGLRNSPGAFEVAEVLGKKESILRVKAALGKLSQK